MLVLRGRKGNGGICTFPTKWTERKREGETRKGYFERIKEINQCAVDERNEKKKKFESADAQNQKKNQLQAK